MSNYFYTARNPEGEKISGQREADDERQLAQLLREEGLVLIGASLEKKRARRRLEVSILRGVSLKEKIFFTRNLQIMISAGIALPAGLETLSRQAKNKKFRAALEGTRDEILAGKSFADGLAQHPQIFPEFFFSMIRVGEEGGKLEEVLGILTRQMEREYELKSKIQSSLIYPAVIILAMLGIGTGMLIFVVPQIAATFQELGIELPLTTRLVIGMGNFLLERWYLLLAATPAFFFLLRQVRKSSLGLRTSDALLLKIPILAGLVKKTQSAYTARTLSSLIASGVAIARALEIISRTLGHSYYQKAMAEAAEAMRKGRRLSDVLSSYQQIYPLIFLQMIEVGEETGQTSEILDKLADFFEEEVTDTTRNLSAIIEPLIMLLIGGAVGFFAISMIQPMYSLMQTF